MNAVVGLYRYKSLTLSNRYTVDFFQVDTTLRHIPIEVTTCVHPVHAIDLVWIKEPNETSRLIYIIFEK